MFPTTNFGDCIRCWTFRWQRHSEQNRRQEVFTRGLDIENLIKTSMIYSVSYFDLGKIGTLFGGLSPPNPPVATGLIQRQMWYQYYVVCSSMYASQLRCDFRKAYIYSLAPPWKKILPARMFRGTCPSIAMLKGYMARESLGTPGLDQSKRFNVHPSLTCHTMCGPGWDSGIIFGSVSHLDWT